MKVCGSIFLMVFFSCFLSCQKDEPYIPQNISNDHDDDCEQDMEYSEPVNVLFSSPYAGIHFYSGDTMKIKAISTSTVPLVSSECYIYSLTNYTFINDIRIKGHLHYEYVVDDRVDSIMIEIGGIQLNGYKDGSCGIQQMWRSAKIKVRLNH